MDPNIAQNESSSLDTLGSESAGIWSNLDAKSADEDRTPRDAKRNAEAWRSRRLFVPTGSSRQELGELSVQKITEQIKKLLFLWKEVTERKNK